MDLKSIKLSDFNLDRFSPKEKKVIIALLVIEAVLVIAIAVIILSSIVSRVSTILFYKEPTPTPYVLNIPLVVKAADPTPTPIPTPVPTATPIILSNVWTVMSIEENVKLLNGKVSDVATFSNINHQDTTIRAFCIDPGWPTPAIGQRYIKNADGKLVPEVNNSTNTLQRFQILE